MLEWMHDPDVQKGFRKNTLAATLMDTERFCRDAIVKSMPEQGDSLHFAIVNEMDEYLGTVSLKDIDLENNSAEYAIATRKVVWGKGVAN